MNFMNFFKRCIIILFFIFITSSVMILGSDDLILNFGTDINLSSTTLDAGAVVSNNVPQRTFLTNIERYLARKFQEQSFVAEQEHVTFYKKKGSKLSVNSKLPKINSIDNPKACVEVANQLAKPGVKSGDAASFEEHLSYELPGTKLTVSNSYACLKFLSLVSKDVMFLSATKKTEMSHLLKGFTDVRNYDFNEVELQPKHTVRINEVNFFIVRTKKSKFFLEYSSFMGTAFQNYHEDLPLTTLFVHSNINGLNNYTKVMKKFEKDNEQATLTSKYFYIRDHAIKQGYEERSVETTSELSPERVQAQRNVDGLAITNFHTYFQSEFTRGLNMGWINNVVVDTSAYLPSGVMPFYAIDNVLSQEDIFLKRKEVILSELVQTVGRMLRYSKDLTLEKNVFLLVPGDSEDFEGLQLTSDFLVSWLTEHFTSERYKHLVREDNTPVKFTVDVDTFCDETPHSSVIQGKWLTRMHRVYNTNVTDKNIMPEYERVKARMVKLGVELNSDSVDSYFSDLNSDN